jgi:hypothetical protein
MEPIEVNVKIVKLGNSLRITVPEEARASHCQLGFKNVKFRARVLTCEKVDKAKELGDNCGVAWPGRIHRRVEK